jgi:hypothetical protein
MPDRRKTPEENYPVSTNIPVPGCNTSGMKAMYPWATMPVGGSFFAPGVRSMSTTHAQKRHGRKFTASHRVESGVAGVRVWRTE